MLQEKGSIGVNELKFAVPSIGSQIQVGWSVHCSVAADSSPMKLCDGKDFRISECTNLSTARSVSVTGSVRLFLSYESVAGVWNVRAMSAPASRATRTASARYAEVSPADTGTTIITSKN